MAVVIDGTTGITTPTLSATTPIGISSGGTNTATTPTAGGVVYGDGTAHLTSSAGTSGQVLTSAGSGAPTWAAAATTLLSTAIASASSVVDFVFTGSYTNYQIIATNVVFSVANQQLYCLFSIDNGATFDTTAGNYYWEYGSILSAATPTQSFTGGITSQTEMRLMLSGSNTNTAGGANFVANIPNPANASFTNIYLTGCSTRTGATQLQLFQAFGSRVVTTGAVNAIRFLPPSGTFTSGTFKLYGIS